MTLGRGNAGRAAWHWNWGCDLSRREHGSADWANRRPAGADPIHPRVLQSEQMLILVVSGDRLPPIACPHAVGKEIQKNLLAASGDEELSERVSLSV